MKFFQHESTEYKRDTGYTQPDYRLQKQNEKMLKYQYFLAFYLLVL